MEFCSHPFGCVSGVLPDATSVEIMWDFSQKPIRKIMP
jgi:hypothetical protein